jgi:hypothetical protein
MQLRTTAGGRRLLVHDQLGLDGEGNEWVMAPFLASDPDGIGAQAFLLSAMDAAIPHVSIHILGSAGDAYLSTQAANFGESVQVPTQPVLSPKDFKVKLGETELELGSFELGLFYVQGVYIMQGHIHASRSVGSTVPSEPMGGELTFEVGSSETAKLPVLPGWSGLPVEVLSFSETPATGDSSLIVIMFRTPYVKL